MSMNGATHRPNRDEVKHPITHTITSPNFEVISRLNLTDSAHDSCRSLKMYPYGHHTMVKKHTIKTVIPKECLLHRGGSFATTKLVIHTGDLLCRLDTQNM